MKRYATRKGGKIESVDILDRPESLQIFLRLNNPSALPEVNKTLKKLEFHTMSHTSVAGHPTLVLTGPRREAELIEALSAISGPLTPQVERKPFDAWKVRSIFGFSGQILQFASSVLKNKVDGPLLLFSTTNLAANVINLVYRGQKRDDPYQLRVIKREINDQLAPKVSPDKTLPDINDERALLREHVRDNTPHPFNHFMQRYSVSVGELGLRYVGAFGMAFPASDWKKAWAERRMPMTNTSAPLRTFTGLTSIAGKTLATTSKVPDPYNPEEHSTLQEWREKYAFLAGGIIEAGAFSALTYDAVANSAPTMRNGVLDTSRSLKIGNTYHRDWLSGAGGALFVSGYIARSWAKYGERKVDMPEVYAHASDALAVLPREQLPQALADISSYLANHFKEKSGLTFGQIYNKISDDLCREHHITIMTPAEKTITAGKETTHAAATVTHPQTTIQAANIAHEKADPHLLSIARH